MGRLRQISQFQDSLHMNELHNTGSIIRKFEPLLKGLTKQELLVLNKMVVERLRLMHKAESLLSLTKFNIGDTVCWTGSDGMVHTGIIIRLNNKTASVKVGEDGYWKISPQFLRKV